MCSKRQLGSDSIFTFCRGCSPIARHPAEPNVSRLPAVYAAGDAELFFPFGDAGGFVNQYRIRGGVGYRRSFK